MWKMAVTKSFDCIDPGMTTSHPKVVAGVRNGKQKLERIRWGMTIQWTRETEAGRTDLKMRYQKFNGSFRRQGA